MLASFFLSLREGLEAALIIGIVFGALRKINRPDLRPVVWKSVIIAVSASILAAVGLNLLGARLEGTAEIIFEGTTMLLAAGLLTWMIFWMRRQSRMLKSKIESKVQRSAQQHGQKGLFLLVFFSILREGLELALFLLAVRMTSTTVQTLTGVVFGLGAAILLGYLLFATTARLSLGAFFRVTDVLLILFAAGLVAHGVHEFNEIGWIPPIIDSVWDINHLLPESSTLGLLLKALLGYNGNPSLSEVIAYLVYFVALISTMRLRFQPLTARQPTA